VTSSLYDRLLEIERLRGYPAVSDVVYPVEEGTPNAELKRSIQKRADLACRRARSAIEGRPVYTELTDAQSMHIAATFLSDPEGPDFIRLATLTEALFKLINARHAEQQSE